MSMNTVMNSHTLRTFQFNGTGDLVTLSGANIITVSVTNGVGYYSGIIQINSLSDIDKFSLFWRPKMSSLPGRWLPFFIDLIGVPY